MRKVKEMYSNETTNKEILKAGINLCNNDNSISEAAYELSRLFKIDYSVAYKYAFMAMKKSLEKYPTFEESKKSLKKENVIEIKKEIRISEDTILEVGDRIRVLSEYSNKKTAKDVAFDAR